MYDSVNKDMYSKTVKNFQIKVIFNSEHGITTYKSSEYIV